MLSQLPIRIQQEIRHLLMQGDFRAAKVLYDRYHARRRKK